MVLRAEYILLISLVILFAFILKESPHSVDAVEANSSKEIYFKNFSLVELTERGVENRLLSTEATKYKNSFSFTDVNITYKNSHHLLARKALYRDDFVYLEDNVSLKRDDNFSFISNSLEYSLKEKIARSGSFRLDINSSIISGEKLQYSLDNKSIIADNIHAIIYFK